MLGLIFFLVIGSLARHHKAWVWRSEGKEQNSPWVAENMDSREGGYAKGLGFT